MNNWWIAVLEHFGVVTREEAEHLSKEINTSVGRENYRDAVEVVRQIIENGKFESRKLIPDLQADIKDLQLQFKELQEHITSLSKQPDIQDKFEAMQRDFERVLLEFEEVKKKVLVKPAKV